MNNRYSCGGNGGLLLAFPSTVITWQHLPTLSSTRRRTKTAKKPSQLRCEGMRLTSHVLLCVAVVLGADANNLNAFAPSAAVLKREGFRFMCTQHTGLSPNAVKTAPLSPLHQCNSNFRFHNLKEPPLLPPPLSLLL